MHIIAFLGNNIAFEIIHTYKFVFHKYYSYSRLENNVKIWFKRNEIEKQENERF